LSTKADLEQACIDEAGCRFTQASDTPMLVNPLLHLSGETGGSSAHFKQVITGTFQAPSICDAFAACLLSYLYHPALVEDIPHSLS